MTLDLTQVPVDLRNSDRAVIWRAEQRDGHSTKVPYQPRSPLRKAAVNDPNTWGRFSTAIRRVEEHKADGVGIVLTRDDNLVGVDLDGVIDASGAITPEALAIVRQLQSYTEITPSRRGLRIFVRGSLPRGRRVRRGHTRHTGREIYSSGKYLTITGWHLQDTPFTIETREAELAAVHAQFFGPTPVAAPIVAAAEPVDVDDATLLQTATAARNGAAFTALWRGDLSSHAGDRSAADLALCNLLAFWTGRDRDRMDRLFRQSGLMRAKWDSTRGESTYGAQTIAQAIAGCRSVYQPPITIELEDDPPSAAAPVADPDPVPSSTADAWPRLHPDAYCGLMGEFVHALAPQTESDPAALLGTGLAMFGNAVGRTPHLCVGADIHHLHENLLLVGDTRIGRKGQSWADARTVFAPVDPDWATRLVSGLSSGEGLIASVRDPGGEDDVDAPTDKRLLVKESEFARMLRVSRREGNTLSAVLRDAWDNGDLRVLTRIRPLVATGAHISIVGHITPTELRKECKSTDMGNGLLNRFLVLAVRRSQYLPDGGHLDPAVQDALVQAFITAIDAARRVGTITRDPEAQAHWCDVVYRPLTRARAGLVGALCNRASAHVVRLSAIYALADRSPVIRLVHQRAAVALWEFAEASIAMIFGRRVGNLLSDYLLALLREYPDGLTRTQIRDALGRNRKAEDIHEALQYLLELGLAQVIKEPASSKGGPRPERWIMHDLTT